MAVDTNSLWRKRPRLPFCAQVVFHTQKGGVASFTLPEIGKRNPKCLCLTLRLFGALRSLIQQETRLSLGQQVNFPVSRPPKNPISVQCVFTQFTDCQLQTSAHSRKCRVQATGLKPAQTVRLGATCEWVMGAIWVRLAEQSVDSTGEHVGLPEHLRKAKTHRICHPEPRQT